MRIYTPDDPDLTVEEKVQIQLPPELPPVPFDMGSAEFADIDADPVYSTEPANLRTLALLKSKYADARVARLRARELCLATGERIHRFFETGRAWVAQVYKPLPAPGAF